MICDSVRKRVLALLDRGTEESSVAEHLTACRDCERYAEDVDDLRSALREMPVVKLPSRLATQLQVMASRERARRLAHVSFAAMLRYWRENLRLIRDNMMRPLALPAAGGLASAVVLFSVLVPTLVFSHQLANDVPSGLYTQSQASVDNLAPFSYNDEDIVVQVSIDERGSIVDYAFPGGKPSQQLCNDIANMILFTKFTPATAFGVPISGKLLVSFRRFNIKG